MLIGLVARRIKKPATKPANRYLTFSLRTLFLALTALAVWLGVVVNRAREQREAVKAIEALGGYVIYDWQLQPSPDGGSAMKPDAKPTAPAWIRRVIGDDFFQEAKWAGLQNSSHGPKDSHVLQALPHFQRLHGLEQVWLPWGPVTFEEAAAALPKCQMNAYPLRFPC